MEPRNMQEREGEAVLSTPVSSSQKTPTTPVVDVHYADAEDRLKAQVSPNVLGYDLDRDTLTPIRRTVTRIDGKDYGADPIGDGMFRMVPSGDVVDYHERCKRLGGSNA